MDRVYFNGHDDIIGVSAYFVLGEQQHVTLQNRNGDSMVLKQGALSRHVWIDFFSNKFNHSHYLTIPLNDDQWKSFFDVAQIAQNTQNAKRNLRTLPLSASISSIRIIQIEFGLIRIRIRIVSSNPIRIRITNVSSNSIGIQLEY